MTLRKWLRRLGAGLVVLSFYLLLREILQFGPEALQFVSELSLLFLTFTASLLYAALLTLPAAAWSCALQKNDGAFLSKTAVIIYARCNILKYLPGNVFHFGGRQVMAHRAGWSHRRTMMATTLEIVTLPLAAGCTALGTFVLSVAWGGNGLPGAFQPFNAPSVIVGFAGLTVLGMVAVVLARRRGIAVISLAAMGALEVGFFISSAALIVSIALAMAAAGPAELPMIALAYLLSWAIGFVVPGAPGGIGVREATFVHLAGATVGEPAAIALAILARLITTLGDLWFALFAHASALPGTAVRS